MLRSTRSALVVTAAAVAAACASTSFVSSWRNPAAEPGSFKGQKVVALVMSKEQGVRFGAEDALARELTARGIVGIAAYSLIPKELTQDKEKAKEFIEKANVVGVVAMRVVGKDQQINQSAGGMYWAGRPTRPSGAVATTATAGAASTARATSRPTRSSRSRSSCTASSRTSSSGPASPRPRTRRRWVHSSRSSPRRRRRR